MTPRAAEAIIRQISKDADHWSEIYAPAIDRDIHVAFADDVTREDYISPSISFDAVSCRVVGAWIECPETGDAAFAGSRAELVALIGEATVAAWEWAEGGHETEARNAA